MHRVTEYDKEWEIDDSKGQLGLLRENHYRPLFSEPQIGKSLRSSDVWLDIGANIGAFAVRAAPYVSRVIAVEPEPDNIRCLRTNLALNEANNVRIVEGVVVGTHVKIAELALSNSFSSTHRLGKIRGRNNITVTAFNIDDIVRDHSVNKIKMDCEGTEAEIIENMDLSEIDEIIFEYHFAFLKDDNWSRFNAIIRRLRDYGFAIKKQPVGPSKTWHTIVWARRE